MAEEDETTHETTHAARRGLSQLTCEPPLPVSSLPLWELIGGGAPEGGGGALGLGGACTSGSLQLHAHNPILSRFSAYLYISLCIWISVKHTAFQRLFTKPSDGVEDPASSRSGMEYAKKEFASVLEASPVAHGSASSNAK